MKVLTFLSIGLLAALCRAEEFAPFGRIVTVVQSYGGTGLNWIVWAVQPGRIVIYTHPGSGIPDKLLGEVAIAPEQEAKLRHAMAKIPSSFKGRIWFSPDVDDGVVLSIHFTLDGSERDDDIVLENLWRPEFRDLCTCISSALPSKLKITFEDIIGSRPNQQRLTVVSRGIKEYRAASQPKNEPWWKFWK